MSKLPFDYSLEQADKLFKHVIQISEERQFESFPIANGMVELLKRVQTLPPKERMKFANEFADQVFGEVAKRIAAGSMAFQDILDAKDMLSEDEEKD